MKDTSHGTSCYHQSVTQYDEAVDEETGETIDVDFEICKECHAVILNDKIIGYDKPKVESDV